MAGGVFMNVKMNKRIQEIETAEKTYFMPSAGDESTVLGLIMYTYVTHKLDLSTLEPLHSVYHGIHITHDETAEFIHTHIE